MYDVGARRVLVMGTGPMGCVPAELAQHSRAGECSVELQRASDLFNPQLNDMLKSLNDEKGDQVFVAANTMKMHMDYISNPQAYGSVWVLVSVEMVIS
ncbi:putative triacylglycerol lipase [Helianthus annuus]|nr:putative triacylglycerol lipase [Helianthus annuus]